MHKYISLAALGLSTVLLNAQTAGELDIVWGAETPTSETYLVGDSSGTALSSSSMVVLGAFTSGFDLEANKYDIEAIYNNFIVVGTVTVGSPYPDGYFNTSTDNFNVDTASIVGLTAYMLVLDGVTDYQLSTVLAVSEYAVLSDSSWGVIPSGNDGFQSNNPEYNIQTTSLDNVVVGAVVAGAGFNGGDMYTTAPVPEPAYYAAGLGVIALLVVQLHRRRKAA